MTYTLNQYATVEKDPLAKGLMLGIAQEGVVADLLSWRTINALSETGTRYDSVPQVGFVPLDGTIPERTVDGKQINHPVFQILHHIDIPKPLEDLSGPTIERASVTQLNLTKRGVAYLVNNQFINGDPGSDPNGFPGLNKIVGTLSSTQTQTPGSQIDISGSSNGQAAVDLIHQGMNYVDGHMPTAGFGDIQFLLRFESVLRQLTLLGNDYNWKAAALTVDDPRPIGSAASKRPSFEYRGIPFYDLGYQYDQTTQVILNTYTDGGLGSSDNTRLYFINEGGDNLEGIQAQTLQTEGPIMLPDKDNYRWRVKWIVGLADWGPRSVTKCIGLKVT